MRNRLATLSLVFVSSLLLQAAPAPQVPDVIVVLDISKSMGFYNRGGKFFPVRHCQKILNAFLEKGVPDGSKVYIMGFSSGEKGGVKAENQKIFEFKNGGKAAAKEFALGLTTKLDGTTFLWSSFDQAMTFAEEKKLYQPVDNNKGIPGRFPTIVLISDGADTEKEDKGPNPMTYPQVLKNHPWLAKQVQQNQAILIKLGDFRFGRGNEWLGRIVTVGGIIPPIPIPPAIVIKNKEVKVGETIKLMAQGIEAYTHYEWDAVRVVENKTEKLKGWQESKKLKRAESDVEHMLSESGVIRISLVGIVEKDNKEIARSSPASVDVNVEAGLQAEIAATFTMKINDKTIPKGNEVWTANNNILVAFENTTTAKFISKGILNNKSIPDAQLNYDWNLGSGKIVKGTKTPNPQPFQVGRHEIVLKVTCTNPKFPKVFEKTAAQTLTIHEFNPPIIEVTGIKTGAKPIFDAGQQVNLQFTPQFPKGTKFLVNSGDGQRKNGNSETKEVSFMYNKAGEMENNMIIPYPVTIQATLPGGEMVVISGPGIIVQKQKGDLFISNKNPWIGDKIELRSLTPIPAGVKDKTTFTWNLGKGLDPVMGEKIDYTYLEASEQMVKLTIKRPDLIDPIVVEDKNNMVNVRGVEPEIVVDPKYLDVFIGESIPFKVVNSAPGTGGAFPPKTEIKWDFGDQKVGAKEEESVSYKTEGRKEVKVSVQIPGVKAPLVAVLPKLMIKPVTVKIGVH